MCEILIALMGHSSFIWGACVGAWVATITCLIAMVIDHRRNLKAAKERAYEKFEWDEIFFTKSYWDQRRMVEIILPEV